MAIRWLLYVMMTLGLAGFGGVAWVALHPPAAPPVAAVATLPPPPVVRPRTVILTAARPLRAGALLGPDDLAGKETEAPTAEMEADTAATRDALLGGMIRHNLPAGAQIRLEGVLRPHDRGFLAAVLEPGMRAVSIGVDPLTGAAGLIWPNDRVDVVLTQAAENGTDSAARRVSGETMLTGLRVVAIDQQLMQGVVGTEGPDHSTRTVTLEVTPAQAERIAVASRMGHLSLTVRASRADEPPVAGAPPRGVTWSGDVSSVFTNTKAGGPLRIYSGPDKTEEKRF